MYTRNNIKKMSNLPVDLWKIEDLYLSFLNILLFYVHANTSSPSTYKRNNMKKISNLPVDRWKITDMYTRNNIKKISYLPVVLNGKTRYFETKYHAIDCLILYT